MILRASVVAFLFLSLIGQVNTILVYILLIKLGKGVYITRTEYQSTLRDGFYNKQAGGIHVYANVFEKSDPLYRVAKVSYSRYYQNWPNSYYFEAETVDSFKQKICELRKIAPISRLEIAGHGLPGTLLFGHASAVWPGDEQKLEMPPDTFKPGAKIKLDECLTGKGEVGEKFVNNLGKAMLKKGGEIYSLQVPFADSAITF